MRTLHRTLAAALVTATAAGSPALASEDGVELVKYMSKLQYFAHKTGLAIDAANPKLAGFYTHEMEEYVEKVEEVEEYDGYPIGKLTRSILVPAVEDLEEAIEDGRPGAMSSAFDALVAECNTCHESAGHAYIRVRRVTDNPYMQSFEPLP